MKPALTLCIILVLLFGASTGLAQSGERTVITPENGSQLVEQIRLGRGSADRVAYAPDGSTIAVAGSVGVWLYDPAALETPTEPTLLKTATPALALAFSPDGATLAVSSDSQIIFWDLATQAETSRIDLKTDSYALSYSPDGTLLAINLGYYGLSLWDLAAGAEKALIEARLQREAAVSFSPDGQSIASATGDYAVHVWKIADGSETVALAGHKGYVYDVAFSPDGALLASASYDKTVSLWDIAGGTQLASLVGTDSQPLDKAYAVAFSADGSVLLSGHAAGRVAFWDVASKTLKQPVDTLSGDVLDIAYSPDGQQFVTASAQPTVQSWDAASGALIKTAVGHTAYMSTAVFSPDSAILAITDWSKNVWLWDTATPTQLNFVTPVAAALSSGTQNVSQVAFAPNGTLVASSDGFDIGLIDPNTNMEVRRLSECPGVTQSFVFSADSTLMALATSEGMCLYNVATGAQLAAFTTNDWANTVTFSPDQTLIAVASKDHTVRVYSLP